MKKLLSLGTAFALLITAGTAAYAETQIQGATGSTTVVDTDTLKDTDGDVILLEDEDGTVEEDAGGGVLVSTDGEIESTEDEMAAEASVDGEVEVMSEEEATAETDADTEVLIDNAADSTSEEPLDAGDRIQDIQDNTSAEANTATGLGIE